MTEPMLQKMCPFFIVSAVPQTIVFYRDQLGFEVWHQQPEPDPFFALLGRDEAMLFVKAGEAKPQPNHQRDSSMRWDAYVLTRDPEQLAAEFAQRAVTFSQPLCDTHDGLRGFEVTDPDGYVLFFGHPSRAQPA